MGTHVQSSTLYTAVVRRCETNTRFERSGSKKRIAIIVLLRLTILRLPSIFFFAVRKGEPTIMLVVSSCGFLLCVYFISISICCDVLLVVIHQRASKLSWSCCSWPCRSEAKRMRHSNSRTHLSSCAHHWQCSPSMAFLCGDLPHHCKTPLDAIPSLSYLPLVCSSLGYFYVVGKME